MLIISVFEKLKHGRIIEELDFAIKKALQNVVNTAYPIKKKHVVILKVVYWTDRKDRSVVHVNHSVKVDSPLPRKNAVSMEAGIDDAGKSFVRDIQTAKNKEVHTIYLGADQEDEQLSFADSEENEDDEE